jgi:hypothetical protein
MLEVDVKSGIVTLFEKFITSWKYNDGTIREKFKFKVLVRFKELSLIIKIKVLLEVEINFY